MPEEGHEVRVYDRLVEQVHRRHGPRHVPAGAEFVRGDMRDPAAPGRGTALIG